MDEPEQDRVAAAADQSADELNVRHWRLDQFIRLGFDSLRAALLAASAVDLAQTRRLVALGCRPKPPAES